MVKVLSISTVVYVSSIFASVRVLGDSFSDHW